LKASAGGYHVATMRHPKTEQDITAQQGITAHTEGPRRWRWLAERRVFRLSWREATEWGREQDERRAAEQRRFAESRTLHDLERLWALPACTTPDLAATATAAEPFRQS